MVLQCRLRVFFLTGMVMVILGLMSGCAHNIPMQGRMDVPATVSQIPIAVGVYYSPEFKNYEHVGSRGGDQWKFPLGPASTKLYDQVLPLLFSETFPVQTMPPLAAGAPECTAVIEPRIEAFNFDLPFLKTGTYSAEITYRFTLYALNGDPVASWTVKGIGSKPGKAGFEFARWPGEAADLAMQDAGAKFLSTFVEVPEVRRWLKQSNPAASGRMPLAFNTFLTRR